MSMSVRRDKNRNRCKLDIVRDMLSVASEKVRKTRIMYQGNLSFDLLEKYLNLLVGSGMLEAKEDGKVFVATPKGLELLADYRTLVEHSELAESKRRALETSLTQQTK